MGWGRMQQQESKDLAVVAVCVGQPHTSHSDRIVISYGSSNTANFIRATCLRKKLRVNSNTSINRINCYVHVHIDLFVFNMHNVYMLNQVYIKTFMTGGNPTTHSPVLLAEGELF